MSIVGFAACQDENIKTRIQNRQQQALRHFPWLEQQSFEIGQTWLSVWGHGDLAARMFQTEHGATYVLIGRPIGDFSWASCIAACETSDDFVLPWDGRLVLFRISQDGKTWTLWNDWQGCIPVFHTTVSQTHLASTLEPLVVSGAGFTSSDISKTGMVELLTHGYYIGNTTLYNNMYTVPPDSIAQWNEDGCTWRLLGSINITESRWDVGWDDLIDEMHTLSHQAILNNLQTAPAWILPLSGGLDSRHIAAVAAENDISLYTYTYGQRHWDETLYAGRVAKLFHFPWKRIEMGTSYLAQYTPVWADWFGTAFHFHGMYQMPFLQAIRDVNLPIVTGFIGDVLAGNKLEKLVNGEGLAERLLYRWRHFSKDEARELLQFDPQPAFDETEAKLQKLYADISGADYQRMLLLFSWTHMFGLSYYQPVMYDYWKGTSTPYINRAYVNFVFSLPRLALEKRTLQIEAFRRYYLPMLKVRSTHSYHPIVTTGRYLLKQRLAQNLPARFWRGPLQEFQPSHNTLDQDCVIAHGHQAVYPLFETRDALAEYVDFNKVEGIYQRVINQKSLTDMTKLKPLQAIAYRLRSS